LFFPKVTEPQESRVPLLPIDTGKLIKLGAQVEVESGIGESINIPDREYEKAGAVVSGKPKASLSQADMVLRMTVPCIEEIRQLPQGCIHISYMDPFVKTDIVKEFAARNVSAISLEMIPRTTIAQKMDVLSSQANLAGYVAVILAAQRQKIILPMMMTPSGTISPARVFVIGTGVAGLQAIATAKRLGARVYGFDVRPEAQEQILSLGARPVKVDMDTAEQTKDGYAKQLTNEQLLKQQQALTKQCADSDIVITTARVFGKKAPIIVTDEMLDAMKPGSLVVDLAVESGGNVESSEHGKEIERNQVTIIGIPELERRVPVTASRMFSSNLYNFVEHFWDKENGKFLLNRDDEIIKGCLITHEGEIVNSSIKEALRT
jgi:NAD(P) transhydrogenase subunit alpha